MFPDLAVAIYVNKCLTNTYQLFPLECPKVHQDVLVLQLKHNFLQGHDFTVVNVYNCLAHANAAVHSMIKVLLTLPNIAIVQGDFNLHSPLWDSAIKGSSTALELYTELSDLGLNLLNNEDEPTWTNRKGSESVIDLLFISDRLCPLEPFIEMAIADRGRSDHVLISCLFGMQLPRPGKPFIAKEEEEEEEYCYFLGSTIIPQALDSFNGLNPLHIIQCRWHQPRGSRDQFLFPWSRTTFEATCAR